LKRNSFDGFVNGTALVSTVGSASASSAAAGVPPHPRHHHGGTPFSGFHAAAASRRRCFLRRLNNMWIFSTDSNSRRFPFIRCTRMLTQVEVEVAEALACQAALVLAREWGDRKIILETDCQKVFQNLCSEREDLSYVYSERGGSIGTSDF
ncbi:hypothetical protein C2S51_010595, partial [Perilla frutescens var. frutescens]